MIQTARVIIAYNLVEKEEVCVHGIECDKNRGMMKKTNESRSQVFHFTPHNKINRKLFNEGGKK